MQKFNPKNKICVITGASSGIGRALAHELLHQGVEKIINIDQQQPDYDCEYHACDVQDLNAFDQVLEKIKQTNTVDVLCNNIGWCRVTDYTLSIPEWQTNWNVNFHSHVMSVQKFLPDMIARQSGTVLFTASAAGLLTMPGSVTYSATKSALMSFAECIAYAHQSDGIGVHALCPQGVRTSMTEYDNPYNDQIKKAHLVGDYLEPTTVAKICISQMMQGEFRIFTHDATIEGITNKTTDNQNWMNRTAEVYKEYIKQLFLTKKVD